MAGFDLVLNFTFFFQMTKSWLKIEIFQKNCLIDQKKQKADRNINKFTYVKILIKLVTN